LGPINLDVPAGACTCVYGPSGTGKTLLLRAIADLDPNTGDVLLGPVSRAGMAAPVWRQRVAYLPAEPAWWDVRAIDHFSNPERARECAATLGLDGDVLDRSVDVLSTGERQRLAYVRALEHDPDVILLDEPTSALDETSVELLERALRNQMASGVGILLVTHDEAQRSRLAQASFLMHDGRLS